jgi:hypothetical protein
MSADALQQLLDTARAERDAARRELATAKALLRRVLDESYSAKLWDAIERLVEPK